MDKWEYCYVKIDGINPIAHINQLNEYGADGYEVLGFETLMLSAGSTTLYLLKRRLQ